MTPIEYVKLLDYVLDNNGWKSLFEREPSDNPLIKYVSSQYDTRDNSIYSVIFQDSTPEHKVFTGKDLNLDNIYRYLDGKPYTCSSSYNL